ncbi:MAG: methyltransferase domain-containing protein [Alphaproteobacteria bacterium]|nr:methyltransferase domain-containing protein [Alphaproteobacteria bacterium]
MTARMQCVQCLKKIFEEKRFFKELKNDFSQNDSAFANFLILTALRRKTAIEKMLKSMILKKIPQKNKILNEILLLGATEILYMDTPDYAAINEYVDIAKKTTDKFCAGMVNAVLRKVISKKDEMQNAICLPQNFVQILSKDYDVKEIRQVEQMLMYEAPLDITPLKDPAVIAQKLGGILFENGTIRLLNPRGDIALLEGYDKGAWFVQDLAASMPVCLLGDIKGKKALDLCAAPGGKTAQLLSKGAIVTALDISKERLNTLKENMLRLNLTDNLSVLAADALEYLNKTDEKFDIVLLDAPCSATGTFRKHPEILYFKDDADVLSRLEIQKNLLDKASSHVNINGILLYCTCSLCKIEGEKQVEQFLKTHQNFELLPFEAKNLKICEAKSLGHLVFDKQVLRTLPYDMKDDGGMDGFFAARLKRCA